MKMTKRLTAVGTLLIIISLALFAGRGLAESQFIHVGMVKSLDIQVSFSGYSRIAKGGEYVIPKGQPVDIRIMVKNRGNRSFPKVEIQSSLHADGMQCGNDVIFPDEKLGGNSISPIRSATLSPGRSTFLSWTYQSPTTLCAGSSHLKIRVQYIQRGAIRASTLLCPAHIIFE